MGGRTNEGLARPLFFVFEVFAIQTQNPITRKRRGLRMGGRMKVLRNPCFLFLEKSFANSNTKHNNEKTPRAQDGRPYEGLARDACFGFLSQRRGKMRSRIRGNGVKIGL